MTGGFDGGRGGGCGGDGGGGRGIKKNDMFLRIPKLTFKCLFLCLFLSSHNFILQVAFTR